MVTESAILLLRRWLVSLWGSTDASAALKNLLGRWLGVVRAACCYHIQANKTSLVFPKHRESVIDIYTDSEQGKVCLCCSDEIAVATRQVPGVFVVIRGCDYLSAMSVADRLLTTRELGIRGARIVPFVDNPNLTIPAELMEKIPRGAPESLVGLILAHLQITESEMQSVSAEGGNIKIRGVVQADASMVFDTLIQVDPPKISVAAEDFYTVKLAWGDGGYISVWGRDERILSVPDETLGSIAVLMDQYQISEYEFVGGEKWNVYMNTSPARQGGR